MNSAAIILGIMSLAVWGLFYYVGLMHSRNWEAGYWIRIVSFCLGVVLILCGILIHTVN